MKDVQHGFHGGLDEGALPLVGADEDGDVGFDEQDFGVGSEGGVQGGVLGDVGGLGAEPGAEDDELAWVGVGGRVEGCAGADRDEGSEVGGFGESGSGGH